VVDITVILDEHAWYSIPENERKEIGVNETCSAEALTSKGTCPIG
jgi:hypothetical protein